MKYFIHISWPNFKWNYLGGKLWYETKSYWHLNVMKKPPFWTDASQEECKERFCMHCGKGQKK